MNDKQYAEIMNSMFKNMVTSEVGFVVRIDSTPLIEHDGNRNIEHRLTFTYSNPFLSEEVYFISDFFKKFERV